MRRHKFNSLRKFEKLEDRRMMVAGIFFADGIITIDGDNYDDVADVRFEGNQVRVDLEATEPDGSGDDEFSLTKPISDVTKIVFNGLAGDDELTVDVRNLNSGVTLDNVYLDFRGGADNDRLYSDLEGGIRVVARGEDGNDTLQGSRFRDTLEGGAGDDDLAGGDDDDQYLFKGTLLGRDIVREDSAAGNNASPDFSISDYAANNDALEFTDAEFAVNVDISNTAEQVVNPEHLRLQLTSATGIEDVFGSRVAENTIIGNSLSNWLRGGDLDDHITGAGGNDFLVGHFGNDTYHFNGTDLGADGIYEWNGALDTLDFRGMQQDLNIDLTKTTTGSTLNYAVNSTALKLALFNNDTIERVYGTERSDTIIGNSRDNHLLGMGGSDRLKGGIGNDTLEGGAESDTYFFAGSNNLGTDLIVEAAKSDTDTLDFSGMPQRVVVDLAMVPGTDYGAVSDNLTLRLSNGTAIENVIGTNYEDVIFGNSRNNHLVGGRSGDILEGRLGNDTLEGGTGDDIYVFAGIKLGTDEIIEAANTGTDTLDFSGMASGVTVNINQFGANYAVQSANLNLKLSNDTAIENVYGTDYEDVIVGNSRNNLLHGGDRMDYIFSDALDEVYGGLGRDYFNWYSEESFSNPDQERYHDWGLI
jgi:Ca2+-binding RTX toxin-like protein